jgi:flavin-binding protein dodecin
MSDRTYKVTEIVGTSTDGLEHAIRNGIERAGRTLRHLDWFEVTEIRGFLGGDAPGVDYFQVTMKLGFRIEGDES